MGRPTERFCPKGHDTAESGRYSNGTCIKCNKRWRDKPGAPAGSGKKRFCRNGHDTDVVGRWDSGTCRACQRSIDWRKRAKAREGLPAVRLRSVAQNRTGAAAAWMAYRRVDWQSATRAAERLFAFDSLSIDQADRWCIALQTHLAIVYPEVYETATLPAEVSA